MAAPIEQILIVSPTSAGIVPQFGDAAVEDRLRQALTELGLTHRTVRYAGHGDVLARLGNVGPRTLVVPNGVRTDPDRSSPLLASVLDRHGLPYVGSDAVGMATMSKIWAKHVLRCHGIGVLPGAVHPGSDAARFVERASQPLVLKPEWGANSDGVTRVDTPSDALAVAEELRSRFGQRIVIEPWARHREYTIAVLETGPGETVAAPLEIRVPPGDSFLSRDVKLHRVAGTHRPVEDPDLRHELCALAHAAFAACGLRDLGRFDVLGTESGELAVIDVNPHPGFKPGPQRPSYFPEAFALERRWAYDDVVLAVIARAAARSELALPAHLSERFADLTGRPVGISRRRST